MARLLEERFGGSVRFGEPLARHTSFRIGGPADAWVEVSTSEEIRDLLRLAAERALPLTVFGTGTNILVSDRGVRGVVLKLGKPFGRLEWQTDGERVRVRAGAAVAFKKLVVEAARRDLGGLEFAEGIPGSIGGGLLMNAGAFGGEISNVIDGIVGVDAQSGERFLPRASLRFGYRRFDLPAGLVVTHVDFILAPEDPAAIRSRMADAKRRRDANQPLGWPNAGSVFKNPPGQFAGRLIESLGFKGRRVGGAMVSEQHANFILNVGGATADDVKRLMDEIAAAVWQEKAVRLAPEIKLVGDWG
jgi:UDP-N-acetylmuramate dehydrogenase